jgi:GGDEF domain-containing protein
MKGAMAVVQRQTPSTHVGGPPTLTSALHQNAQVEVKFEECADEIAAINAMLTGELASRRTSRIVDRVLTQCRQLEEKIGDCAEALHAVNITIAHEIREWEKAERAFSSAQIRLIHAQIDILEVESELARVREERQRDRYFAFHDALTGLPNRNLFNDRLERALAYAKRYQHALAVICIDLDDFKLINDAHSPYIGDKILQRVAQRLLASVRATRMPPRGGSFPVSDGRADGQ